MGARGERVVFGLDPFFYWDEISLKKLVVLACILFVLFILADAWLKNDIVSNCEKYFNVTRAPMNYSWNLSGLNKNYG